MIIKVKVIPSSSKFKIIEGGIWRIYLTKPPENNKANIELIKEMKKRYGKCRILKGASSKEKILEI